MSSLHLLARTATTSAVALAVLGAGVATAGAAVAQTGPPDDRGSAVELEVDLSGPGDGEPGTRATFTVALRNLGSTGAPQVRVTPVVPSGVEVVGARGVDGWTCVMGGDLSCELQGALPPGATAPALPFDVAFADDARGRKELHVDAYQGEGTGATRIDRGTAVVLLTGPAPQPTSSPTAQPTSSPTAQPTAAPTQQPTAAPTTAAPVPVSTTAAPAPVRTTTSTARAVPVSAVTTEDPAVEDAPAETAGTPDETPDALPFADDDAEEPAETDGTDESGETETVALQTRRVADDGVDGWLVALFCTTFVAFGISVVAAVAKGRRAQA